MGDEEELVPRTGVGAYAAITDKGIVLTSKHRRKCSPTIQKGR